LAIYLLPFPLHVHTISVPTFSVSSSSILLY
jgi:hypothetical protein